MSEKDIQLKADSRRLFWLMGFSTKIDVPLRALVPEKRGAGDRGRSAVQAFTDLDVLGVHVSADLRVQTVLADCKTSTKGSTERMFWIRGVSDFFEADDAYMVRAGTVTAASRQLASRLRIAVLTPDDLSALLGHYGVVNTPRAVGFLFDADAIANYRRALTGLDQRLRALREYQEFDFWVYEDHRNIQQIVAHLSGAAKELDPANPIHQALFFESAWAMALSLARAVHHVRRSHVTEIDTSLREYLFGGQLGLREKQQLATVLRRAAGKDAADPDEGVLPPYFGALLELASRFLRRPLVTSTVLRYAEWSAEAHVARQVAPAADVFEDSFDDLAAKLLADVCGFLVTVARLDANFRTSARSILAPALLGSPQADAARDSTDSNQQTPPVVD